MPTAYSIDMQKVQNLVLLCLAKSQILWSKTGPPRGNETPEIGFKVTILTPPVDLGFVAGESRVRSGTPKLAEPDS